MHNTTNADNKNTKNNNKSENNNNSENMCVSRDPTWDPSRMPGSWAASAVVHGAAVQQLEFQLGIPTRMPVGSRSGSRWDFEWSRQDPTRIPPGSARLPLKSPRFSSAPPGSARTPPGFRQAPARPRVR